MEPSEAEAIRDAMLSLAAPADDLAESLLQPSYWQDGSQFHAAPMTPIALPRNLSATLAKTAGSAVRIKAGPEHVLDLETVGLTNETMELVDGRLHGTSVAPAINTIHVVQHNLFRTFLHIQRPDSGYWLRWNPTPSSNLPHLRIDAHGGILFLDNQAIPRLRLNAAELIQQDGSRTQVWAEDDAVEFEVDPYTQVFPLLLVITVEAVGWQTHPRPEPRTGHAMTSSGNGGVFLFGGESNGRLLRDLWMLKDGEWQRLVSEEQCAQRIFNCPPARHLHAMSNIGPGTFLVQGGMGAKGILGDVWQWNGSWLNFYGPPNPRYGHTLVKTGGKTLMFGGHDGFMVRRDLQSWNGYQWNAECQDPGCAEQPLPEPRMFHGAVSAVVPGQLADGGPPTNRDVLVIFGGSNASGMLNDTWTWNGLEWRRHESTSAPTPRESPAMGAVAVTDSRSEVVLFGGKDSTGLEGDTWVLGPEGGAGEWTMAWTRQTPSHSPPRRMLSRAAWSGGEVWMFGGHAGNELLGDAWHWSGGDWHQRLRDANPSPRSLHSLAHDPGRNTTVLFGGLDPTGAKDDTWQWNGSEWQLLWPDTRPPARYFHSLTFVPDSGKALMIGGATYNGALDDAWWWDGLTWTAVGSTGGPGRRYAHAAAFDPGRNAVVVVGGSDGANTFGDTWTVNDRGEWNTLYDEAPAGFARSRHGIGFVSGSHGMVLFGGYNGDALGDTWVLRSGSLQWEQLSLPIHPEPRFGHLMVSIPNRDLVLLAGGMSQDGPLNDLWGWDGMEWMPLTAGLRPETRWDAAMAYDSERDQLVMFGGRSPEPRGDTWLYRLNGRYCLEDLQCLTGMCRDGVCCGSDCGGPGSGKCQSCNRDYGPSEDGTCLVRPPGSLCREVRGVCDVADYCSENGSECKDEVAGGSRLCRAADQSGCDVDDYCRSGPDCPQDEKIANGTSCNDQDLCSLVDVCLDGTCIGTDWKTCDATDGCHENGECDSETGICSVLAEKPTGSPCDDDDLCTGRSSCQAGACVGTDRVTCVALDQCHNAGTCDPQKGTCSNPQKQDGTECSDDAWCTDGDRCVAGICISGGLRDCGSYNRMCKIGVCSEEGDACAVQNKDDGTTCDDGLFCTVQDACVGGECKGTTRDCHAQDGECTTGECDEIADACTARPRTGTCNDTNKCTTDDMCVAGECKGKALDCSINSVCKEGYCNTSNGRCEERPRPPTTRCDDGKYCTESDHCQDGECVGTALQCGTASGGCRRMVCNNWLRTCVEEIMANGSPCSDDNGCTVGDSCVDGVCQSGPECVSGPCERQRICNAGRCVFSLGPVPQPGDACSNGDPCITNETCDAYGVCGNGTQISCSDGSDCTYDWCESQAGCLHADMCHKTPNTPYCDTNLRKCVRCVRDDQCQDPDSCWIYRCRNNACEEATPKNSGVTCKSPNLCLSNTRCDGHGYCVGQEKYCNDGLDCTRDYCLASVGECEYQVMCPGDPGICHAWNCEENICISKEQPDGTICNDGTICTKMDACYDGECWAWGVCDERNPCCREATIEEYGQQRLVTECSKDPFGCQGGYEVGGDSTNLVKD